MRCEQIIQLMGEHLDGCLDADRTRELNDHLAGCESCRRELEELRQTLALLRALPPVAPPSDLLPSVRRHLAQEREVPLAGFWRVLSLPQIRVAAAAALVIVVGVYGWRTLTVPPGLVQSDIAPPRVVASARHPAASPAVESAQVLREEAVFHRPAPMNAPVPAGLVRSRDVASASLARVDKPEAKSIASVPARDGEGCLWKRDDALVAGKATGPVKMGLSIGSEAVVGEAEADSAVTDAGAGGVTVRTAPAMATPSVAVPQVERESLALEKQAGLASEAPTKRGGHARGVGREIILATGDAAAVRNVLARYVVAAKKESNAVSGIRAKTAEIREDKKEAAGHVVEGWIPAGRYSQLLDSLKALGIVNPPGETTVKVATSADIGNGERSRQFRAEIGAEALIFVRITVVAPSK